MALTELGVKHAKCRDRSYRLSDGRGLYLQVEPNGSKYWRLAYRFQSKQKTSALGILKDVSLTEARDLTTDAKILISQGVQHTVRYTELSPQRFKDFWKD